MLEVRNILHFTPFYFKNNKGAKDKFFVVLKRINDDKVILASLPSSQDHIPAYIELTDSGCVELPDANFNCFAIMPSTCVTECGKFFKKKTFLYGHQISDYNVANIRETYRIEGVNFSVFGKMEERLFDKLIACFKNSKSIKRKYKRELAV